MEQKQVKRVEIKGAVKLSAREMNSLHFSKKHTVLTPEQLAKMAGLKVG
ncbi:MAG: hypothetical protein NC411_04820 [Bacteroides sp.]|nr:hypothetical protein [Bacteroides sp.]